MTGEGIEQCEIVEWDQVWYKFLFLNHSYKPFDDYGVFAKDPFSSLQR